MTSYRIDQLTAEARGTVRTYALDTGSSGTPDGVLGPADLAGIDAALARPDVSPQAKEMIRQVRSAATDGLAVPRSPAVNKSITDALRSAKPWNQLKGLSADELKGLQVDERIAATSHIVNKTGLGWWEGRANNEKERKLLEILTSTPDHQKGELMQQIMASGLSKRFVSAIDGAEYDQYKAFMRNNVWRLDDGNDIARVMREFGMYDLSNTVDTIGKLRKYRGDAFTEGVLQQLLATRFFEPILPFVYWSPMLPSCNSMSDVINRAGWVASQEVVTRQHKAQLEQFLQAIPPGRTAETLRGEFTRRHNIQRLAEGFDFVACAAQAALAEQRRRQEQEEEAARRRRSYDYGSSSSYGSGNGIDSSGSGNGID